MHGEAPEFIDWAVLWMLWYVSFLGFYGLLRMRTTKLPRIPPHRLSSGAAVQGAVTGARGAGRMRAGHRNT
jgi:hypothetical protein